MKDNGQPPAPRIGAVLIAVLLTAAFVLLIGGAIIAGQLVELPHGAMTAGGATRVNQVITIYATVLTCCLVITLLSLGIDDMLHHRDVSPLYPPILAVKAAIFGLFSFLFLYAVDLLRHDLRPGWAWLYDPDVRLIGVVFYVALVGSLSWLLAILLRGRGLRWGTIGALYALLMIVAAIVVLAGAVI